MKREALGLRPWLLGLVVAAILILNMGILRGSSSVQSFVELKKSRDVMQKTVADLKHETGELSSEIMRLKKSSSYAKKVLRDKYHVTEPDEDIVFFAE